MTRGPSASPSSWPACLLREGEAGRGLHAPIAGTLQLTIAADAGIRDLLLGRPPARRRRRVQGREVKAGTRTALAWREEVSQPRAWKLKFGPPTIPTYQLIVDAAKRAPGPSRACRRWPASTIPAKSLAIAYFAIPLDGEKDLKVDVQEARSDRSLGDRPAGRAVEGVRVVGIPTPRYLFLDGFDPERVDAMQLSWSCDFWNFDHVPERSRSPPERIVTAKTDAKGACRLEGFVGWVGVSERDERFAMPRSLLAMADLRSAALLRRPESRERAADRGGPARAATTTITERGLLVEGDWPLPRGFKPARWSERLSFLQGKSAEFFTPCREVRVRPMSKVHQGRRGGGREGSRARRGAEAQGRGRGDRSTRRSKARRSSRRPTC